MVFIFNFSLRFLKTCKNCVVDISRWKLFFWISFEKRNQLKRVSKSLKQFSRRNNIYGTKENAFFQNNYKILLKKSNFGNNDKTGWGFNIRITKINKLRTWMEILKYTQSVSDPKNLPFCPCLIIEICSPAFVIPYYEVLSGHHDWRNNGKYDENMFESHS